MEDFEAPESEALRNEVVWQRLGSYLSPGDLKDCRLVSKTFDEKVRGLKKWKERMQLHLTKRGDVWGPPGFRVGEDTPSFEAVRLTLSVGGGGFQEAAEMAQDAAEGAREAAQGAQEAAEEARKATEEAEEAAQGALKAAEMAEEAARGAQQAAQGAQQEPQGSREAAQTAQVVAQKTEEAAQRAQEAAEEANKAAERAQEAADKVQDTAEMAIEAAQRAQKTAQRALEAAQGAQEAAEREGAQETSGSQDWSKVFKTVKCLTLDFDQKVISDFDEDKVQSLGKTLAFVLGHCTSALHTLIIDRIILAIVNVSTSANLNTATVLERIRGLRRLDVTNGQVERTEKLSYSAITNIVRQMMTFDISMQFLGNETPALEELTLGDFADNFSERSLRALITPKVNVIKKLEIGEIDAVSVEGVTTLVFPNLTHLSLRISACGAKLMEFLGKQPDLQSLTIKVHGRLSHNLLNTVKTKSANLVALKIKCWNREEVEDWSFLSSLKKLREFSFTVASNFFLDRRVGDIGDDVEDFFYVLPKGLRKISIRSGFGNKVATRHCMLETLRSEAGKFKELEELSIVFHPFKREREEEDDDDDDDSNDEFLRFIGTKGGDGMFPFPKLKKLHLSHVTICDEDGKLLGENAFWAGLDDVSIQNVRNVSEDSIIEKLSGTQICRLSLRGIKDLFQISKEGVQKIVENNKCLEALTSNHPGIEKAHRLKIATYKPLAEEGDSDSDVETAPPESDDSWDDFDGESDNSGYEDLDDDDDSDEEDDVPDLDEPDNS